MAGATVGSYIISCALKYKINMPNHCLDHLLLIFLLLLLLLPLPLQVTWLVPQWAATSSAARSSTTCLTPPSCSYSAAAAASSPAGDMAGATVGSYIISRALKYNMPKRLVLRMLINQAIDSCVGVIPFLGDLFDFGEGSFL
jgi:hypothetical protein